MHSWWAKIEKKYIRTWRHLRVRVVCRSIYRWLWGGGGGDMNKYSQCSCIMTLWGSAGVKPWAVVSNINLVCRWWGGGEQVGKMSPGESNPQAQAPPHVHPHLDTLALTHNTHSWTHCLSPAKYVHQHHHHNPNLPHLHQHWPSSDRPWNCTGNNHRYATQQIHD